jgi:hypothetical protein
VRSIKNNNCVQNEFSHKNMCVANYQFMCGAVRNSNK